ncbi:hypothetical protein OSB04_001257 [Centaurea solstitialis]|uniref:HAT C-terminal dimerisation domain-containing protein n=1 Tax=Centaurea solstitialis TaxID=347529 RepID=A0AA38U3A2_9ASTR|nr:hypothetical protein OSB04_001257 [Centaurea solstitialis]
MSLFNLPANKQSKRSRTITPTSELGNYMATNFIANMNFADFENFDILAWWKEKEGQFPILVVMTRDLLNVQPSTVASEFTFSVSGRVVSQRRYIWKTRRYRRSRLSPESVECCICLKDYLDGVAQMQHVTTLEDAINANLETSLENEEIELGISPPNEDGNDDGEEIAGYE